MSKNMAQPESLLSIEPQNELKFRGPFTVPVTSYMKITNPGEQKVAYKIKTTAPKKYCVRPNGGVLDPDQSVEIAVSLQPFEYDHSEKNKHKFMVQALVIPDEDYNLDSLWRDTSVDSLRIYKLKCVFEVADTSSPALSATSAVNYVQPQAKMMVTNLENVREPLPVEHNTAAREITRLREELSRMRQENFQLKEETVRLRSQTSQTVMQLLQNASVTNENLPAVANGYQTTPYVYLVVGVVIGLFAMLLGKYIF